MPQRKVWTEQEDRVLRLLKEERQIKKWADMPAIMSNQFGIEGRTAKQCRERYHNHLSSQINNSEWNKQEEDILFQLQNELGNKWAVISSKLPGRTDSQVKNHFYSKLRKALRKVNRVILRSLRREYKDIKTSTLYRILETFEARNRRTPSNSQNQNLDTCKRIRDRLREFENREEWEQDEQMEAAEDIALDFSMFDSSIKKAEKKNGSLYGSGNLYASGNLKGSGSLLPVKDNLAISSRSAYDDESDSRSNSDIYSSTSYGGSNSFMCARTRSLQSQDDSIAEEEATDQRDKLWTSTRSTNELMPKKNNLMTRSTSRLDQLPLVARQNPSESPMISKRTSSLSKGQSNSRSCGKSSNGSRCDVDFLDQQDFGGKPQTILISILTPKPPTDEERMQISEQRDMQFCMQMRMQEQILHRLSGISLMGEMPRLGRDRMEIE